MSRGGGKGGSGTESRGDGGTDIEQRRKGGEHRRGLAAGRGGRRRWKGGRRRPPIFCWFSGGREMELMKRVGCEVKEMKLFFLPLDSFATLNMSADLKSD